MAGQEFSFIYGYIEFGVVSLILNRNFSFFISYAEQAWISSRHEPTHHLVH